MQRARRGSVVAVGLVLVGCGTAVGPTSSSGPGGDPAAPSTSDAATPSSAAIDVAGVWEGDLTDPTGSYPIRVVLDSRLRLSPRANVVTDGAAPTILATTDLAPVDRRREFTRRAVEVLVLPSTSDGRVHLGSLLDELGARGMANLLVEGGAGVITAMIRERRVSRLVVSIAPLVLGSGIEAVGDLDILRLRDALSFRRASFSQVGPDVIFDGELEPRSEGDA